MRLRKPIATARVEYGGADGPAYATAGLYVTSKDEPAILYVQEDEGQPQSIIRRAGRAFYLAWDAIGRLYPYPIRFAWGRVEDGALIAAQEWAYRHDPQVSPDHPPYQHDEGGRVVSLAPPHKLLGFDPSAELADRNLVVCTPDHVWIAATPPDGTIVVASCEDEEEAGLVCEYSTSWLPGKDGQPDRRVPDTLNAGLTVMDEGDLKAFGERVQVILHRIRTRRVDTMLSGKGLNL